jgi:hypothetical protein
MFVYIINPAIDRNPGHQDPKKEKKEIQSHQDPENLIGQDLFQFDLQQSHHGSGIIA